MPCFAIVACRLQPGKMIFAFSFTLACVAWKSVYSEEKGVQSAFHGAHSDAMCLSAKDRDISKRSKYLVFSLRDKKMSRICPLVWYMTGGRISPLDYVSI